MVNRRHFLLNTAAAALAQSASPVNPTKIRHVDIVHHTHTDIGYTELPSVIRDLQIRYLDAAIDCCRKDPAFRWTIESLVGLNDWWHASSPQRHDQLLALVRSSQIDVMAMPFNQTPFLNARQWRQMMRWIPEDLFRSFSIRAAMQNDVNGLPRAGAIALLDHGISRLLMGLNADSGGPPFYRPSAFWWKMPGNRRFFVWLGEHYGSAMNYLKPARDGTRLLTDDDHVRAAHAEFTKRTAQIEADGYPSERLILTFTHPLNYDNGGPFPTLAPFIAAWNRLQLQPTLRLTTATEAILAIEKTAGPSAPELTGEWTDWWANGDASGPREVAASRAAKRYLTAAESPLFGPLPPRGQATVEAALRDLCLFDEHTWGSHQSISAPFSHDTLAQYTEKSDLAYRPMGHAEMLLRRRVRAKVDPMPAGTYILNPAPEPISGWAGAGPSRVWVEKLAPHSAALKTDAPPSSEKPDLRLDPNGWPLSASWKGMPKPLFDGALGDFLCTETIPPANRRTLAQLHAKFDSARRAAALRQSQATYARAASNETPHTLTFTQEFQHPRLTGASRTLEVFRRESRARLTVRFHRISSLAPEVLHLDFALPSALPLPILSCGGVPFTPYRDQLKGSCRDYFAIDAWAHYQSSDGNWLWVTRDAPLIAIGAPHVVELHQTEPQAPHRILAMVFDNCWHTNFVADSHGLFEFQFDLVWSPRLPNPGAAAEALLTTPILQNNPPFHESDEELRNIYRP